MDMTNNNIDDNTNNNKNINIHELDTHKTIKTSLKSILHCKEFLCDIEAFVSVGNFIVVNVYRFINSYFLHKKFIKKEELPKISKWLIMDVMKIIRQTRKIKNNGKIKNNNDNNDTAGNDDDVGDDDVGDDDDDDDDDDVENKKNKMKEVKKKRQKKKNNKKNWMT